jgi:hypothetical protein
LYYSTGYLKLLDPNKLGDMFFGILVHFFETQLDHFLEILLKFVQGLRLRVGSRDARHYPYI